MNDEEMMDTFRFNSLRFPLLLSGSVHLSLLVLLGLAAPAAKLTSVVELTLIETSSGAPVHRTENVSAPQPKSVAHRKNVVKPKDLIKQESVLKPESVVVGESLSQEPTDLGKNGRTAVTAQERYIAEIARLLNAKKRYPSVAKKLRQQGRVMVQFRLARDGRVLDAAVVEPSAYPALNQSAQSLIQELKGLKPFPEEIKKTTWLFSVPVDYQM